MCVCVCTVSGVKKTVNSFKHQRVFSRISNEPLLELPSDGGEGLGEHHRRLQQLLLGEQHRHGEADAGAWRTVLHVLQVAGHRQREALLVGLGTKQSTNY